MVAKLNATSRPEAVQPRPENTAGRDSHNDPFLRDVAERFSPKEFRPSIHDAAYTPANIRNNLQSNLNEELSSNGSKAALAMGTAGLGLAGMVGYGTVIGSSLGAPALLAAGLSGPIGLIGIPVVAGVALGAWKGYKVFSAWNAKRKGLKALEKGGY